MDITLWLSLAIFVVSLGACLLLLYGSGKIRHLKDQPSVSGDKPPAVSIIIPALDEAGTIEPALRSVLAIDYPDLEIIVVNDRSVDATPDIIERLSRNHSRLKAIHIRELPPGWLGKNHALQRAAQQARGDYLLFTDADVVFAPSTIRRAVAYCEQRRLDHLAAMPDLITNNHLLRMLMAQIVALLFLWYKPWKMSTSPTHWMGSGAFNMVRKRAYLEAGGHAAISLAVVDDMMLGKLMKLKKCSQDVLAGDEMISVEWYRSVPEMFRGLRKNVFASLDFSLGKLFASSFALFMLAVWPWVGLFATEGTTRLLNLAALVAAFILYWQVVRLARWSPRCLVYWPVVSFVSLAIWWESALFALIRGEIEWRGTRYPLAELRRNHF